MKNQFEQLFIDYLNEGKKVDSNSNVYQVLCKQIPREINNRLNRDDLLVKGSMGQGNRTDYPWISILNKNITRSTQEGLYIVFLFRKDMKGVYLTLSQGITHFTNKYQAKKYIYAEQVAKYFQQELSDFEVFTTHPINLMATKSSLGYGYEKTTILSKYYEKGSFNDDDLWKDLFLLLQIYDLVYKHMSNRSYEEIIESVLSSKQTAVVEGDKAITTIEQTLYRDANYPHGQVKMINLVTAGEERSKRFRKFTAVMSKKTDFVKKAAQDIATGLEGEKMVLEYEKKRLFNLGYEELAQKVRWVAEISDSLGYDIESYDVDQHGKAYPLYIEVKTTVSKVDVDFLITRKELQTSVEKQNNYAVYRIFDALNVNLKMYIAKGKVEDNFFLDPETYSARYKWAVQ